MTFSTGDVPYYNYTFRGGMLILLANTLLWGFLGIYFDQVIPSQYGVAKPWYFLCRCKRTERRVIVDEDSARRLLEGDDVGSKDRSNFEAVPDSLKKQEKQN